MMQPNPPTGWFVGVVDDQLEQADFMKSAILVMLVAAAASLVFQRLVIPEQVVRASGPLLIASVALIGRYLIALGRVQAAKYFLVVGVWSSVTFVVAVTNGVQSSMVTTYPLLILATGWLMDPRAALIMAGATIVVAFSLAIAELAGVLPMLAFTPPGLRAGTLSFIYAASAVMVFFAVRTAQRKREKLNEIHGELAQRSLDLEISQAELSAAQAVANVGSWVYDFRSDTLHLSAEACRMVGMPEKSTLKWDEYVLLMHEDDRAAMQQVRLAAEHGAAFDVEYRLLVGDRVRWMRSKSDLRVAARISPHRRLGIVQDITERKQSEAALLAAKAEAEEASRTKSSFLAAVSHDLGQPLSALALLVGVLQQSAPAPPKRLVQNMQECVDGMAAMLSDLMVVSKLDAGVVVPEPSEWSVQELLETTVSVHAGEAQKKGLRLRVRRSETWTYTDRKLVQRIVGNLVSNAIRYTQTGGVLIACRTVAGKQWIEVWDTGIGIPQDKLSHVFEEFAQLKDDARNLGSGLGLSIVAKATDLLGLQLRLRSTLGKGSMFAVELPPKRLPLATPSEEDRALSRPLRIGLVEDNPLLLESLVIALDAAGYQVVPATTANDLLARLADHAPDLVVSDFRLANGENGLDVIDASRAKFGNQLPCLIITADRKAALRRAMVARHITMIYKPLDIKAFLSFIREATGRV